MEPPPQTSKFERSNLAKLERQNNLECSLLPHPPPPPGWVYLLSTRACERLLLPSISLLSTIPPSVDDLRRDLTRLLSPNSRIREGGNSPINSPPIWHPYLLHLLQDGVLPLHQCRWPRHLPDTNRLPTRLSQNLRRKNMNGYGRNAVDSARSAKGDSWRHRRRTCPRSICERS